MTTPVPVPRFAGPAPAQRQERAATALRAQRFTAEIPEGAAAARTRIEDLIPEGASVLTGTSETLRLPGIDAGIKHQRAVPGRQATHPGHGPRRRSRRHPAAARQPRRRRGQRRRGHRNRLPGGRPGHRQPAALLLRRRRPQDLDRRGAEGGPGLPAALRRAEDHALPLETVRAQKAYRQPSALNHLLILNAGPYPGRSTVLLLRQPTGF